MVYRKLKFYLLFSFIFIEKKRRSKIVTLSRLNWEKKSCNGDFFSSRGLRKREREGERNKAQERALSLIYSLIYRRKRERERERERERYQQAYSSRDLFFELLRRVLYLARCNISPVMMNNSSSIQWFVKGERKN